MTDSYFRLEDYRTTDGLGVSRVVVQVQGYYAVRRTAKGVWLAYQPGAKPFRFMLTGARQSWAHETREKAVASYKKRKAWQAHLRRLDALAADTAYRMADEELNWPAMLVFHAP